MASLDPDDFLSYLAQWNESVPAPRRCSCGRCEDLIWEAADSEAVVAALRSNLTNACVQQNGCRSLAVSEHHGCAKDTKNTTLKVTGCLSLVSSCIAGLLRNLNSFSLKLNAKTSNNNSA